MKTTRFLLMVIIILSLGSHKSIAQDLPLRQKKAQKYVPTGRLLNKLSPSTGLFILKRDDGSLNKDSLYNAYAIRNINGKYYASVFILSNGFNSDSLDFLQNSTISNITTGLINVDQITSLANQVGVDYVQIGSKANLHLDEARRFTKVNEVHIGVDLDRSYKGEGVVVGIIDQGFDYTHPSFYDSSLTAYRVKRVWDQNLNSGIPPQGFTYGTELSTQSQIISSQTDLLNESHGSHVAGIAAGSGPNTNNLFTGVAPKSDLVFVSYGSTNTSIVDAVNYIFGYATSVNKPCVINMSLGVHIGPHDGNSTNDLAFDFLSGEGKIIVGAAGNEGQDSIHIRKTFSATDSIILTFIRFPGSSNFTNGYGLIDIWGTPNQEFWTAVNIVNSRTNSFEDWTPYISSESNSIHTETLQDGDLFPDDLDVKIASSISPNNNKANVQVEVDHTDQDDNYRWVVLEIIAYSGTIDLWFAWPDKGGVFTNIGRNYPVIAGSTTSTAGEIGGTGRNVISVGAYTSKNQYTNLSNQTFNVPSFSQVGDVAPFSSHGPTADNRTKPDITAPGNILVAPVNSFDANFQTNGQRTIAGNSNGTNTWYYGALEGTSMASPMVTGILALWLERNPDLTPDEIKLILKEKSDQDSFTGSIPSSGNNTWGWGKINAHEGLKKIVGIRENQNHNEIFIVYPNPSKGKVYLRYPNGWEKEEFEIINSIGQVVQSGVLSMNELEILDSKGVYVIRLPNRSITKRILIN